MRFPFNFTRFKGGSAGQPVLGTNDAITGLSASQQGTGSCIYSFKARSPDGFPVQRLAFFSIFTGTGPVTGLTVQPYYWDDNYQLWIAVTAAAVSLTPGVRATVGGALTTQPTMAFMDGLSIISGPVNMSSISQDSVEGGYSGSPNIALVVADPGAGAPNGQYDFAAAALITTP